ncbi:carboxypeptidase C prc1 [Mortierella alpina]|uniref:Carboxypeptidase C prc1 n=1 Tax=Mortierella alpina TaxID=64518 RepID=A0A9P6J8V4_MORAP|nr:carboxypeptidase C prc1 [Mortierella alpina]
MHTRDSIDGRHLAATAHHSQQPVVAKNDPAQAKAQHPILLEEAATTACEDSSSHLTLVHSEARSTCLTPEPHKGMDTDQDAIYATLEDHCQELGVDAANVTQLVIIPSVAPITLTTRQVLHQACDDLYQDIVRRRERIERWISRIITIAENIRESPDPYLQTNMAPMSRARLLQMTRLQRFQYMVGKLRVRWDQCAYLPADEYDHALSRLFDLAESQGSTMDVPYLRVEAPLCLSKECLASLTAKLANLDKDYCARQTRIRAVEHMLRIIYQDLDTSESKRVVFRKEASVKYSAELGRELKSLQQELEARKLYLSGERWIALAAVWDSCLVSELEREAFKAVVDADDVTFVEKLARIQSEIDNCHSRFSRSGDVYKLMMTRSSHIERMIAFEHTAKDPKRLFQASFRLVDEDKFRRKAYPTLLNLEEKLLKAIEKFEGEQGETFMYEGLPYLETLRKEIDNRHVNETVFAKFTPKIAAPTRSQTIEIMGRPISPIPASSKSANTRSSSSTVSIRSANGGPRRVNTTPVQSLAPPSTQEGLVLLEKESPKTSVDQETALSPTLRSLLLSYQRDSPSALKPSASFTRSLKSKSSLSSLSVASTSASVSTSASATNSPLADPAHGSGTSYFASMSPSISTNANTASTTPLSSSPSSPSSMPPYGLSYSPTTVSKQMRSHRSDKMSSLGCLKSPSTTDLTSSGNKRSLSRPM